MKKMIYGENKNVISEKLKLLRVKNGLTQSQLAAKMQVMNVNIDQQIVSKIESNKRIVTDYELVCFCRALKTNVSEMLEGFEHITDK